MVPGCVVLAPYLVELHFLFMLSPYYYPADAISLLIYFPLLQAVELWLVDRAVLPIENSLGGSIHRNYDLLLRHRLHIVGEVQLAVHHCLLGMPGVKKEELQRVLSHPQVILTF
jgi:arogenate/prephenate dehydratase